MFCQIKPGVNLHNPETYRKIFKIESNPKAKISSQSFWEKQIANSKLNSPNGLQIVNNWFTWITHLSHLCQNIVFQFPKQFNAYRLLHSKSVALEPKCGLYPSLGALTKFDPNGALFAGMNQL